MYRAPLNYDRFFKKVFGNKKIAQRFLEDFLDIVMELRKRHKVEVPAEDYPQLASMASCVAYLTPKMQ
jgi:hypothetical protein